MKIRLTGAQRKALAERILADIDAASVGHFKEEPRDHLGASEIGEKCARHLVYKFRWFYRENFSGAMHRLFNRGHKEEARFADCLKWIGAQVWTEDGNGKQFRIDGGKYGSHHFGGSLDGATILPPSYELPLPFLLEMKTHNQKSFDKLKKYGVKQSKPKHYVQMCMYGADRDFDYAIYMAVNKNTDELYIEIVEIDKSVGEQSAKKALAIINCDFLPNKIAASEAYLDCKFCSSCGVCHLGHKVNVNCRSCKFSMPASDGTWFCNHWLSTIPKEKIPEACGQWVQFT